MPSLSFNEKFVPAILSGTKTQTIRRFRKRPIKVGDRLFLFTGMRTKYCVRIGQAVCTNRYVIKINRKGIDYGCNVVRDPINLDALARMDGFKCWDDMRRWWLLNNGLPFKGHMYMWENFTPAHGSIVPAQ